MPRYTRNISLGGVFIEPTSTMPFGAKACLKFRVPTQTEAIEVDGQVRWLEMEDGQVRGIGIRFEGLRARDVWALNKFFEKPNEETNEPWQDEPAYMSRLRLYRPCVRDLDDACGGASLTLDRDPGGSGVAGRCHHASKRRAHRR